MHRWTESRPDVFALPLDFVGLEEHFAGSVICFSYRIQLGWLTYGERFVVSKKSLLMQPTGARLLSHTWCELGKDFEHDR